MKIVDAFDNLAAASAEAEDLRRQALALGEADTEERAARAALDAISKREADLLIAWSRDRSSPRPDLSDERRAAQDRLARAQEAVEAAARANVALNEERASAAATVASAKRGLERALLEAAIDEHSAICAELLEICNRRRELFARAGAFGEELAHLARTQRASEFGADWPALFKAASEANNRTAEAIAAEHPTVGEVALARSALHEFARRKLEEAANDARCENA